MSHEFQTDDRFIVLLHHLIRFAVKVMAGLMVLVIMWGVVDVVYVMGKQLLEPPVGLLKINDILETLGTFLAVLIAIEIFMNITLYLRNDVIDVNLVVATALMAVARKVIVFDYDVISPGYVYATALTIISLGVTYWLLIREGKHFTKEENDRQDGIK